MQKRKCFGKAFTVLLGLQVLEMSKGDITEVNPLKTNPLLKGTQRFVAFGVCLQQKGGVVLFGWFCFCFGRGGIDKISDEKECQRKNGRIAGLH